MEIEQEEGGGGVDVGIVERVEQELEGLLSLRCWRGVSRALRDSQPTGETRANKSPQLPPVRAICLDGRLMPDIIHPGNNTLLPNEV